MFVGIREITHAKGRFGLIIAVVGMITLLIVMLTGLTAGLGKQNTSALEALDPKEVVFSDMAEPSFTTSQIAADEVVAGTTPLGTAQTLLQRTSDKQESVAVMGLPEDTELPDGTTLGADAVASESLNLNVGESVDLGPATITVGATAPDLHYSHTPVIWVPTETWQQVAHTDAVGTVLLAGDNADVEGVSLGQSFNALPAYSSEQGSLQMMQGFLYLISALVTVAFLTVWTMQRTRDLAILKGIGAPTSYLMKDALSQAAVILGIGVVIGTALALGLGALAGTAVPFVLTALTIIGPAVGIWLLGMAGAAFATRSIAKINPQLALGGVA